MLEEHEGRLLTSDFVFDETLTLARHRLGYSVARQLGEAIRSGSVAQLVQVSAEDQESAWRLFCRRHDQRLSFTDCTSFVLIQRLKLSGVITLDADFRSLGLTTLP